MRVHCSIFVLSLAAAWSACALAQEVALVDFNSVSGINVSTDKTPVAMSAGKFVAQSMQAHFDEVPLAGDSQIGGSIAFDRADPPTVGLAIAVRIRGRRSTSLLMPDIPDGYGSGLQTGGGSYCDGASYVPTWWLSREVEARRALHFGTLTAIACEFGIPTRLLDAVIAQESGYKHWAVSSAGAMGMMQIMPGTARLLGLALPFDPLPNMRAGARYLRQQLDRFGRVDLALAAYNAGPGRRSLQRGYIPAIPETLDYVRTITTNWARLTELGNGQTETTERTFAALSAVRASGYRDVELIRYVGLKRANPM